MDMEAMIALGGVLEAHANRHWRRGQVAPARAESDEADRLVLQFGMFEDCGDSYHEGKAEAAAVLRDRESSKVQAEKRFKALREGFREAYPHLAGLMEERIGKQAAEHARLHQERTAAAVAAAAAAPSRHR